MIDPIIREVALADHETIRKINQQAFDGPGEARLIDALRKSGDVVLELVATDGADIVGHILFSRLIVASDLERIPAVALAPLAVAPAYQKRGIGGRLISAAHMQLAGSEGLSVVLGDPAYYGRFGYDHSRAAAFECEYQCDALQALCWSKAPEHGRLVYAAPFAEL